MFINLTSLTSLHQPTNERNLPQRQVALHDIGHKEQQQNGTVRHTQVNIFYRDIFGSQIEYCRKQHITTDSLQVILNGILLLPYEIGQKHGDAIATESCPGTSHIAVSGNQKYVHHYQYRATYQGEISAPTRLVNQLVPEGKIEVDTHKDFGSHHDGHYPQPRPVVATDNMAQDVQIEHDSEECSVKMMKNFMACAYICLLSLSRLFPKTKGSYA